ncbi:uncharacterized protein DSM5745_03276 [Aspergillus mulundensis]|uniref:Uncharacterized protein n=1 Tax=Aspergillus mulundensis TaxID=1810919 RepID=A0A3D8SKA4_9EURO|nr:hypothetical protein DSM5745_03276 [Aspergillus mulundensis]RDW86634.1 hypothetical protein DSM5745_03276 [Aspergillus mulundensis]
MSTHDADFLFVDYHDDNPQNRSLEKQKRVFAQNTYQRKKRLAAAERLKASLPVFRQRLQFEYNPVPGSSNPNGAGKDTDDASSPEAAGARADSARHHQSQSMHLAQLTGPWSPQSPLGQGFIDPFSTTALPMHRFMDSCFHHPGAFRASHPADPACVRGKPQDGHVRAQQCALAASGAVEERGPALAGPHDKGLEPQPSQSGVYHCADHLDCCRAAGDRGVFPSLEPGHIQIYKQLTIPGDQLQSRQRRHPHKRPKRIDPPARRPRVPGPLDPLPNLLVRLSCFTPWSIPNNRTQLRHHVRSVNKPRPNPPPRRKMAARDPPGSDALPGALKLKQQHSGPFSIGFRTGNRSPGVDAGDVILRRSVVYYSGGEHEDPPARLAASNPVP